MSLNIYKYTISSVLLALLISIAPVNAQFLDVSTKSRDVALLFHKMGGLDIDYKEWAMDTQEYATAVDGRKSSVLKDEIAAVQLKYTELDDKKTDIVIRTQIAAKVEKRKDVNGLALDFSVDGPLFFPYKYMNEEYALIAKNIDLLKFIPLGKLEASYIGNKLSGHGKTYMILKLRPYKVDTTKKTPVYDNEFWMMLSRVASIHLYNTDLESLWSWTADWYITEQEVE